MALNPRRIPFGLADIIIGEGENEIRFDGEEEFQNEGGELTLTPIYEDIQIADFGTSVYDRILIGYEGELTFAAAEQSIETMQLAIAGATTITDTDGGEAVGLMDDRITSSAREKAVPVRIHPRRMEDDDSLDIHIYKMSATGDFTRGFANEQGSIPVTFTLFPKDGMNANEPGNFYYIGPATFDPENEDTGTTT